MLDTLCRHLFTSDELPDTTSGKTIRSAVALTGGPARRTSLAIRTVDGVLAHRMQIAGPLASPGIEANN